MFNREDIALQYYEQAWQTAQNLPENHALKNPLSRPVQLPAFNYSKKRDVVEQYKESVYVPLTFDIDLYGRVKNIERLEKGVEVEHYSRARRAARRLLFRPIVENGTPVGMNQYSHDVRVLVRRKSS